MDRRQHVSAGARRANWPPRLYCASRGSVAAISEVPRAQRAAGATRLWSARGELKRGRAAVEPRKRGLARRAVSSPYPSRPGRRDRALTLPSSRGRSRSSANRGGKSTVFANAAEVYDPPGRSRAIDGIDVRTGPIRAAAWIAVVPRTR